MINRNTVFVLGAGANVPYGFSTGGGLVQRTRSLDPRALMGNAGNQITAQESAAFAAAASDNMLPSIDALLEHREDLQKVGKRVMATLLYQEEATARPRSFEEDWMSLLFSYMSEDAKPDEFSRNAVSFVTFNYDRYMEHRFIRGLVARYRVEPREAWQKIAHMFVHLYGTLGDLPEQRPAETRIGEVVPLGAPDTPDMYTLGLALPLAENAIKIVHNVPSGATQERFDDALRRFLAAEQIFFLGFAFAKKNVERLRTDRVATPVVVYCTTYDMTPAELDAFVFPAFPRAPPTELRHQGSTGNKSISQYLREHVNRLL